MEFNNINDAAADVMDRDGGAVCAIVKDAGTDTLVIDIKDPNLGSKFDIASIQSYITGGLRIATPARSLTNPIKTSHAGITICNIEDRCASSKEVPVPISGTAAATGDEDDEVVVLGTVQNTPSSQQVNIKVQDDNSDRQDLNAPGEVKMKNFGKEEAEDFKDSKLEEVSHDTTDYYEEGAQADDEDSTFFPSPLPQTKRPRRVMFDPNIRLNRNEPKNHGLNLQKFNGMGTHEIVQRMADRGYIMFIDGCLKWVGPTAATAVGPGGEKRTWTSMIAENGDEDEEGIDEDDDDMTVGGPFAIYQPMKVTPVNTTKCRYRKKKIMQNPGDEDGKVDPSSIVPVSGSLGSTGSVSETDLGTDEDEDDADLASQGWIVTKGDGTLTPSPPPGHLEFELIEEEPEFILQEPIVEGPPAKKKKKVHQPLPHTDGKIYPKPGFSYSCLIAMSLKNSKVGSLPVSEIYKFMCDHFPYFKSAPSGWKNSVRHNLSLNKCFEKIEKPGNAARKGCLWALCPDKIHKMDEEVQKWLKKDIGSVIRAMSDPENLELIERGELKRDYSGNGGASDEDEDEDFGESQTPVQTPTSSAGRDSRTHSIEATVVGKDTIITSTPVTMSQLRSLQQQQHLRVIKQEKGGETGTATTTAVIDDQTHTQTIDLTKLGGSYHCNPNGTFTLSFPGLNTQSSTPIIIRRTPVK